MVTEIDDKDGKMGSSLLNEELPLRFTEDKLLEKLGSVRMPSFLDSLLKDGSS